MAKKLPEGYGTKLPEGYGTAAPGKAGAAYAKAYSKKKRRKRAARVLRKKKKGSYRAFVKRYLKEHKGATIVDAAKAWKKEA